MMTWMNIQPLLGVLDLKDYGIITVIVVVFAGGGAYVSRQAASLAALARRLNELDRKMDAVLKHLGIELPPPPPSGLSQEVERLAREPNGKIAAIKLYREKNPEVGLADAKRKLEAFLDGKQ